MAVVNRPNSGIDPFLCLQDYDYDKSARFHPDTFFITFPDRFEGVLRSESLEATQLLLSSADGLWFQGRVEHERLHWMHMVGSSFGLFLAMLRQRANMFATLFWDDLSNAEIAKICAGRRAGRPPFCCDASGTLRMDDTFRPASRTAAQLCLSSSVIANSLKYCTSPLLSTLDVTTLFGHALDLLRHPYDPIDSVRRAANRECDEKIENSFRLKHIDTHLSAAALEEALALISQISFMRNAPPFGSEPESIKATLYASAKTLQQKHLDDPTHLYTRAFRYFADHVDDCTAKPRATLFLFGIIVDLALNPRLPPLSVPSLEHGARIEWEDILPSRRFQRLVTALCTLGFSGKDWSEANAVELLHYRETLLEVAGLSGWDIDEAEECLTLVFRDEMHAVPRINRVPLKFLVEAALSAVRMRRVSPHIYINTADTWLQPRWAKTMKDATFDLAWICPFVSNGGIGISRLQDKATYNDVLLCQTINRTLIDCAVKTGAIDYDGFPCDAHFDYIKEQAALWLNERYAGALMI